MTYYEICWYFVTYSFAGWVVEVIFHAVTLGRVVNRGFLNGPVCPVYGFGMLAVFALSSALPGSGASGDVPTGLLFLVGMALTTSVELIAGFILDRAFHARWWDYTDKPFNFHGYICLEFSIIWGLGVVMAVRIAHPVIRAASSESIPPRYGWPVLACCYALYAVDTAVSILTMQGLNRRLEELDEISRALQLPSDRLTKTIAESTIRTQGALQEGRVQANLAKAELRDAAAEGREVLQSRARRTRDYVRMRTEDLQARREELLREIAAHPLFGPARFLRAFPQLTHRKYGQVMQELKRRAADSGLFDRSAGKGKKE